MDTKEYLVYALTLGNEVFYVGKTCNGVENRIRVHLRTNINIINFLNGRKCYYRVLEKCTKDNVLEREIFWITTYKDTSINCRYGKVPPKLIDDKPRKAPKKKLTTCLVDSWVQEEVLRVAQHEERSVSSMILILLKEALNERSKKE